MAGPRANEKARAEGAPQRAGSLGYAGDRLFDFDVIAGVNGFGAVGNKNGGRVAADVYDDAFAQHFAWQVVPVIPPRRAAIR